MKKATASLFVLLSCATVFAQQTSRVFFDLCYDAAESPAPVSVRTGCMMQPADKPLPVREGYRFGGWYTSPECLPEQEWRFGSGTMDIEIAGTGGGELYVGPYLGEAYNDTRRCSSDYDITIRFSKPQPAEGFKAFIGGLQASGTYIDACEARGCIRISGRTGSEQVFIGGIVGSERYGTVSGCSSSVRMEASDTGFAQAGGIVGEFNSGYGVMGAAFGVTTTVVRDCSYAGRPVFRRVSRHLFGETAGAGEPEALSSPWGLAMAYKIENCTYKTR